MSHKSEIIGAIKNTGKKENQAKKEAAERNAGKIQCCKTK